MPSVKLKRDRDSSGEVIPGEYITLDGKFTIGKGEALTTCNAPHPMGNGKYCHGWQDHPYASWEVWDNERGDYLDGYRHYDTMKEAREALDDHYVRLCPIGLKDAKRFVYV